MSDVTLTVSPRQETLVVSAARGPQGPAGLTTLIAEPEPAAPAAGQEHIYLDQADGLLKAKKADGSIDIFVRTPA